MENEFRLDVDELASLITLPDADARDQLAGEPDGRRADARRPRGDRRPSRLRHDLVVLADEIYGRILYDGEEHVSIASLPGMADRTIVLDGFSKTFAMTGWRLGYAIVPPSLVSMYGQLIINTISCAPTFAQIGAVEALRGPQADVDAMVVEFRARRDLIVDGLNAIPGIRCLRPTGAFYAFPDISGTGLTGAELAEKLLHEAGVCVLAGTAFGGIGTNHIRISYANSRENLTLALDRIRAVVEPLVGGGLRRGVMARPRVFVARRIPDDGHRADRRRHRRGRLARRAATAPRRTAPRRCGLRRRPDPADRPRRRRVPRRGRPRSSRSSRTTPSGSTTSTSRRAPVAASRSATRRAS